VLAVSTLLTACDLLTETRSLTVALPDPPPHWAGRLAVRSFAVGYIDEDGRRAERIVAGDARELEIRVLKGFVVPITARPLVDGTERAGPPRLPPAGALYPKDAGAGGVVELSWRHGFTADLMLDLADAGLDLEFVNTERLGREIDERAGDDPFRLDRDHIARSLLSGRFRVTDIRARPVREVSLRMGSGGTSSDRWFTESPFSPLYTADDDGNLRISLTHGFHHLFHAAQPVRCDVYLDETEVSILRVEE